MKYFVFFLTLLLLGTGTLFNNISPALAVPVKKIAVIKNIGVGKTLGGANLASCLARQNAIKNRFTALFDLTTNTEKRFDAITQRTVDYYNNTIIPSGKSIQNYNVLIANIQTRKDTIQAAMVTVKANSDNFSCAADDPKLLLAQYRLNMLIVKRALNDYRASINNLITAIRLIAPAPVKNIENNQ